MALFHEKLVRWIIQDNQPFTVVENSELKDIFCLLRPEITVISAGTIRNEIKLAFWQSHDAIKIMLQVRSNISKLNINSSYSNTYVCDLIQFKLTLFRFNSFEIECSRPNILYYRHMDITKYARFSWN